MSGAKEWRNCWLNKDGSKVSYLSFRDWVYRKYNQYNMNENLYMEYFNEQCKDVGIYEIGLTWKKGGGHCTMIERKANGTLRYIYIEPQKDNSKGSEDEWKDIGYLCREMTNVARSYDGVVRCDNKLFNVKDWIGIVKIIKRKR